MNPNTDLDTNVESSTNNVEEKPQPAKREVMLGGDRTALEMLNDLIFDDNSTDVSTVGDENTNNLQPYINTTEVPDSNNKKSNRNNDDNEDNSEGPYEVTEADVAKLQRQVVVDDDRARELLIKHNGDQVAAMLEVYDVNYKPENPTGVTIQRGMNKGEVIDLNDNDSNNDASQNGDDNTASIVVDMDTILENHENDPINNYQYAVMSFNTDSFRPHKKHCKITELVRKSVVPAMVEMPLTNADNILEKCEITPVEYNRLLGLDNDSSNKLKCLHLNGMAKPVFKKWGMYECGMLFYESQVVPSQYIVDNKCFDILNKHATNLGRLIGYLDDKTAIVGNCVVINNTWFTE